MIATFNTNNQLNAHADTKAVYLHWVAVFCGYFSELLLGLLLGLFLTSTPLHANTLQIAPSAGQINLPNTYEMLEDPEGKLSLAQVQQPAYASRFQRRLPDIGFSASAWWIRISLVSNANQALTWWFDTQNRTVQEITFFAPNEQGVYQAQSASSTLPFAKRPLPSADFVFPFVLLPEQKTEIWLRVRSTGYMGVNLAPRLWQAPAYQTLKKTQTAQWLVYLGMAGGLSLFNLMLAFFLKDINYLLYSSSVVALAWSISSGMGGFGSAYEYFWPNSPLFEQLAWLLSTCVTTCCNVAFFLSLANFRTYLPRMARFVQACLIVLVLLVASQLLGTVLALPNSAWLLQKIYIVGASVFCVIYITVFSGLFKLASQGSRPARFLCIAWLPVFLSVGYWVTLIFSGRPFNVAITMWASAFELILMSLALADLFNQEKKAKEQAQAKVADVLRQSGLELEQKVAIRTQELQQEQSHTKELLHNILPEDVANELSETGRAHSARHASVTILFTDFVGFTKAVSSMSADHLVADLNEIFAAFDDISDACGVEKIKTIGDAYMAAAGLPKPCPDHAQRCVRAAQQMIAWLHQKNSRSAFQWGMRVGIHSGPVVSGVVGKRKFAFDIWGDTVNIAARIESAGEDGKINISAYTCELIQNEFKCEYRGRHNVKNMGELDMYFVTPILSC